MNLPKTLLLALLAASSLGTASHANDISLHPLSQEMRLASLSPSFGTNVAEHSASSKMLASDNFSVQEYDVWVRIRQGFGIPDLTDNPLVEKQIEWYAARPEYIQRITDRASRYLFHIVQELEARGMPTELALLPFIESAFNPHAKSTAKAVGMWQFIPSTGRNFNLNQSTLKDERRNVLASTEAALNYLQKLYGMFGDWQLALAAYNWGEGSVQRAIKKSLAAGEPADFNGLADRMPAETRNYVPKLQAVKAIVANPAKYGVKLPKIENQPYFVTLPKTRDMDVAVAARLADMTVDDFRALNPQFGRHVITGGTKTQILLPLENVEKFKANLAKADQSLCSWTAYRVTSGKERLETIAASHGATPDLLREVNNIPPKMLLKAGSIILVPKTAKTADKDIAPEIAETATIAVERDGPPTKRIAVKVGKKDTLVAIAKRHRVTVSQIKSWNSLKSDRLAVGARLELHVAQRTASNKNTRKTVKKKSPGKRKTIVAGNKGQKKRSG